MAKDTFSPQRPKATRAMGEVLMSEFVPRMGKRYAQRRNFDNGAGGHVHVSTLSPYVRRRLVLERDVVEAAVLKHGLEGAEKFVQEVIWRGYFKGWLERRPQIWQSYRTGLQQDLATLDKDRQLARDVARAEAGQTGLECFDGWAQELVETGYLHNHARMWFASIWIFTLGLPWRLGADFFYRHLLDGDPASNTLGWRWVAGLHTRGKTYAAQAWNIAKFTGQRFTPRDSELAADTQGLETTEPNGLPSVIPLRTPDAPLPGVGTAVLITEEDCRVEDFELSGFDICAVATLSASHLRSPLDSSELVQRFEADALRDAANRIGFEGLETLQMRAGVPSDLATWAERAGASQIVTPYVPEGPLRDWLREADPALRENGITLCEMRRSWDEAIWPHATAGFFKVKKKIPDILRSEGIDEAQASFSFKDR